jgi:hypothetical protein
LRYVLLGITGSLSQVIAMFFDVFPSVKQFCFRYLQNFFPHFVFEETAVSLETWMSQFMVD